MEKNIKSEYNNNKFKISTLFWNYTFDLPDGLFYWWYSGSFRIYYWKHETLTEDLPIEIYPNKIKKRIVFKIRSGYKLG